MRKHETPGAELLLMKKGEGHSGENGAKTRGMVLPFTPLSLAFEHVNYYVDMPAVSCFYRRFCKKKSLFYKHQNIIHDSNTRVVFSRK